MLSKTARPAALLASVCFIEVLSMAPFATFPTLIPQFQAEWEINNSEAGWIGGIYFGGYTIAVAILTALTDRVDAKRVYLLSMAVSALSALGFALLASGVWSATLWRMVQGIGLAGTYMPGLKALSDALPERQVSRATAFYTSCFGIGASLSYYLSGEFGALLGWRWAFGLSALGPFAALLLAAFVLPASRPSQQAPKTRLLDFRPVLANRRALGFTLAYTVHNAELFAFRTWIVTFLIFSQAQQHIGAIGAAWSAATIASLVNLMGLPSSVLTNELAARFGRQRIIIVVMSLSAVVGIVFGFSADASFVLLVALAFLFGVTISADSATITAGVIKAADPTYKGTTMAMHSVLGFMGAFLGPILFGVVLDVAGGETVPQAWGLAFTAMAALVLLGPLAVVKLVGLRERVD